MDFGELDGIMQTVLSPTGEATRTGEFSFTAKHKLRTIAEICHLFIEKLVVIRLDHQQQQPKVTQPVPLPITVLAAQVHLHPSVFG